MITTLFNNWDLWQNYHKVTFDGKNRIITVNPGVTDIDIQKDIYSSWKEWTNSYVDNGRWLPAIRTVGGDPTIEGEFAGDIYFLINNWKLQVDVKQVKVTGVLFSDDFESAYFTEEGIIQFPAKVSSVVTGAAQIANSDTITETNSDILSKVIELWQVMGLDLNNPKTITDSSITVNGITITIGQPDVDTTTVTREP